MIKILFIYFISINILTANNLLNVGMHQSQVYFIENYNKAIMNIYREDFGKKKYLIDKNIKIKSLEPSIIKNINYFEVDVTYIEEYDDIFVSYGVMENNNLLRFQVFNGSLLTLSYFFQKTHQQNKNVKFWIDLKNLTFDNFNQVITKLKNNYKQYDFFLEIQDIEIAKLFKKNGFDNYIIWLDINKIDDTTYQKEIIDLNPIAISQHYIHLEKLKSNFKEYKIYTWTNNIEYDIDGKNKLSLVLNNCSVVLIDYDILFGLVYE